MWGKGEMHRTAKEATESMVESIALAATARLPEKNAMIAFKTDRPILRINAYRATSKICLVSSASLFREQVFSNFA